LGRRRGPAHTRRTDTRWPPVRSTFTAMRDYFWPTVWATVAGGAVLGVLVWLFQPLRRRLEHLRTGVSRDDGVQVQVFSTPDEVHRMLPDAFLSGGTHFYFAEGLPRASCQKKRRIGGSGQESTVAKMSATHTPFYWFKAPRTAAS
ncbi:MAG: hypothetical protein ABI586_04190, partial [Candidatus Nanopelagicales bacterium]